MNVTSSIKGLLAVGLTVVVMALMGLLAAAPLIASHRLTEQIEASRDTLRSLLSRTQNAASLREDNENLISSGQAANLLVEGETIGIAGANLQKIMNDVVVDNGGKALSLQILRPVEDKELVRIGMSLSIEASIDSLRAIAHAIESGSPLIFIENIAVKGSDAEFAAPDPHFIGPLDVTLQVAAYTAKTGPVE